jgi:hypothetical protein
MQPFGFEVHLPGQPGQPGLADADWAISLPHQCDQFVIACDADLEAFMERVSRFRDEFNNAVRALEKTAGIHECGNRCGEWVRPVVPADGVDGYDLVHLGGNPICDISAAAC